MDDQALIERVIKLVLAIAGDNLRSMYLIGSFLTREMIDSSDIDFIGIMESSFDFTNETAINPELNSKIDSKYPIDVELMNYDAFFGGKPKGSILKYVTLSVLLNFLKRAKHVYGEKLNFDTLPVKPASPQDELIYHMGVFHRNKDEFRTKDKIGIDFTFKSFLKQVFYMANLELQLTRRMESQRRYSEIVHAFQFHPDHIVHFSYTLRKQNAITVKEKHAWLDKAEEYVQQPKKLVTQY